MSYCVECTSKKSIIRELRDEINRLRDIVVELQVEKCRAEILENRGIKQCED